MLEIWGHSQWVSQLLVLRAPHQLEIIDGENLSLCILPSIVFQDNHLAGRSHGKIWFRRNNHGKRLSRRGHIEFTFSVLIDENLAGVAGTPVWCDYPQNVG